jgi:hypothetical protein
MQAYSRRQVSTTMNGAGENQSRQEVSTQQFGQDRLHASNSGLKLKLDLNLDVEVASLLLALLRLSDSLNFLCIGLANCVRKQYRIFSRTRK